MGRKDSGALALKWVHDNIGPVTGVMSEESKGSCPVTITAEELEIPVWDRKEVNRLIGDGEITFDLGISFLHPHRIKQPLLGFPKLGIVNFHPAPLPEFKGTGGYNVAILEGLPQWGVSAHYVDEDIDTGPIIECLRFPIEADSMTARSLERLAQDFLLQLFKRTVSRICQGEEIETTSNSGGRYISRAEMEAMKRVMPGDNVERKVRAFWFPPYRGAYVEIGGSRFTLVSDGILEDIAEYSEAAHRDFQQRGGLTTSDS